MQVCHTPFYTLLSSFEDELDLFYPYHWEIARGPTGQDSAIWFQSSSSMKRVNLFNPLVDKAVSGTGECVFGTIPQIGGHLEDQDELKEKRKKRLTQDLSTDRRYQARGF